MHVQPPTPQTEVLVNKSLEQVSSLDVSCAPDPFPVKAGPPTQMQPINLHSPQTETRKILRPDWDSSDRQNGHLQRKPTL